LRRTSRPLWLKGKREKRRTHILIGGDGTSTLKQGVENRIDYGKKVGNVLPGLEKEAGRIPTSREGGCFLLFGKAGPDLEKEKKR